MDSIQDDSMEDYLGKGSSRNYSEIGKEAMVTPLAAFHTELGHISMNRSPVVLIQDIPDMSLNKDDHLTGKGAGVNLIRVDVGFVNNKGVELHNDKEKIIGNENQFVVHGVDGPFLMEKNKWPKLLAIEYDSQEQDGLGELT